MGDIYDVAGRETEEITKEVSSELLVKEIRKRKDKKRAENVLWLPTIDDIYAHLKQNLAGGEVVMIMGAGSIYNLTLRLQKGFDTAS